MSHKQKCIDNAQDYLLSKGLAKYWSQTNFNSYYRKHNGAWANAYTFGLSAADYIIMNALNHSSHDNRNAGEAAAA